MRERKRERRRRSTVKQRAGGSETNRWRSEGEKDGYRYKDGGREGERERGRERESGARERATQGASERLLGERDNR